MVDLDELIAEARECAPGDDATELAVIVHRLADALEVSEKKRAAVLRMYNEMVEARQVDEAADALEAATRVPVQGEPNECPHNFVRYTDSVTEKREHFCTLCGREPNDDREALRDLLDTHTAQLDTGACCGWVFSSHLEQYLHWADAILDAGFSRATVPDAATEVQVEAAAQAAYAFDAEVSGMLGRPFDPDLKQLPQWAYDTHLDRARAALVAAGFSRATVPDAATERAARYIRVQAKSNARWRRLANKTIRDTEAERDAALARIADLEEALSKECRDLASTTEHTAAAMGSLRLTMGEAMVKFGYEGLRQKLSRTEARITEAAKLHQCFETHNGFQWCSGCSSDEYPEDWPCPTAVALGLNEGEER